MTEASEIVNELIGNNGSFSGVDGNESLIFFPVDNGGSSRGGMVVLGSFHRNSDDSNNTPLQSSLSSQVQGITRDRVYRVAVEGLQNAHRIPVSDFVRRMRSAQSESQ